MTLVSKTFELYGKTYTFESGELAKQATGACLVKQGDTTMLDTVVVSKERKNYDFFPLTVDFNEKMYAAGRIPGGYLKREGRPSEKATLTARMIDRPIRPSFPDGFRNEVHIVATSLVADQVNPFDVINVMGASLAMTLGGVPFEGPLACVRIGRNVETGEFIVNEKDKIVNLTADGVKRVEDYFHIENLADPENLEIQHNIILALRANYLMFRDKDYVVKDDEVLIVDEFTGRIMPGRRYSDGLHQAIEAKEHVHVRRESRTLATITFQNFFNKFNKKAGMTGTAQTEEKEFRNIYQMDVISIPTNRPVQRIDYEDAVYKTKKEKFHAVVEEVAAAHEKGQPVLVGTITIETSELLSKMLTRRGIPHKVLNAKFHELEAEIVADAGIHGAVTQ